MLCSSQLNFLQNDARFSLLGQKLWETIDLGWSKVCFSGDEKNTSKYNKTDLCAKYQCKQKYKLLICSVDIIALMK